MTVNNIRNSMQNQHNRLIGRCHINSSVKICLIVEHQRNCRNLQRIIFFDIPGSTINCSCKSESFIRFRLSYFRRDQIWMRQKIIIIGSLLHQPENWIIDEPLTGLDPNSTFELKKIMREHANEGKTVFEDKVLFHQSFGFAQKGSPMI